MNTAPPPVDPRDGFVVFGEQKHPTTRRLAPFEHTDRYRRITRVRGGQPETGKQEAVKMRATSADACALLLLLAAATTPRTQAFVAAPAVGSTRSVLLSRSNGRGMVAVGRRASVGR